MFRSISLAFAALFGVCPMAVGQETVASVPSISVSGAAEVKVAPDEIHLMLGVEVRHANLDTAKSSHDEKVASVLKFLKGAGIETKDIQTDHIGITPHYRDSDNITPSHYSVQRTIGIRVRKVADFEKILTGSLKSGVNHVHGIEFRTTELRKHRDKARQLAIRAAKEKAEALGKELSVEVGKVQSITENTWGGSWSGGGYWGNRSFNNMSQNAFQAGEGGQGVGEDGTLAVGQISVNATVNVTFQLK